MKTKTITAAFLIGLGLFLSTRAVAAEISGYVAVEGRLFAEDVSFTGQEKNNSSIAAELELFHEWKNGSSFTFAPFARADSADPERTHLDIRELNYLYLGDSWELRLGVSKVFWGTTEFAHLVDIVNQTDLVENVDGEEKLGQPMLHLSLPRDWGVLDLFVLPYFRERTFPGPDGRLRSSPVVDTDAAVYENPDEENHIDLAFRYSHTLGNWDLGISHFTGTGREPTLLPGTDGNGNPVLIPTYEQISQTGLDLQLVAGEWLLKLETIYRTGQAADDFFASDAGFEYTIPGAFGSQADISILTEYLYDSRGDSATTSYQNDLALAGRFAFNDLNSTEAFIGLILDTETSARFVTVEASRRFGSSVKATLDAYGFIGIPSGDPARSMMNDDFLRLEVAYYF